MGAQHHHFVLLVGSRQLRDHVEGLLGILVELVLDIEFQRDRNLLVQQPHEAIVVLGSDRHRRNRQRVLLLVGARAASQHRAAVGSAARTDRHQRAFVGEKFVELVPEALQGLAAE